MNEIFNSTFELSLRALLVLQNAQFPLSGETVAIADFVSVYGVAFGISKSNLHGDNSYKYCEAATRREKIEVALKDLVIRGLAELVLSDKTGLTYQITDSGRRFCGSLNSTYADEFSLYSKRALQHIEKCGMENIRSEIIEKSQSSVRRRGNA